MSQRQAKSAGRRNYPGATLGGFAGRAPRQLPIITKYFAVPGKPPPGGFRKRLVDAFFQKPRLRCPR
jgi:hypothetical protein